MLFCTPLLFRLLKPGGLPVRAAVFAFGARLGLGLGLGLLACLICLGGGAAPARAEGGAELKAVRGSPISDGLELMRLGISNNMCALTFDDGPSAYTAELLDTLAAHHIPATFFVVGTQVERRPELIRRMLAEGHEVGNHSYSHTALRKLSPEAQQADLRRLDALLRDLGAHPRFVRPPFGFYDHNTINVVQEMDGHIVMWTTDSEDWRSYSKLDDPVAGMHMLYKGAPLRGVFLFHDTHHLTVERMPEVLDAMAAAGCRFVTLSEYIDAPAGSQDAPPLLEVKTNDKAEPPINFALDGRLDAPPAVGGARDDAVRSFRSGPPQPPPADIRRPKPRNAPPALVPGPVPGSAPAPIPASGAAAPDPAPGLVPTKTLDVSAVMAQ